jgi:protein involved in polysaccharide export with SLBB domain
MALGIFLLSPLRAQTVIKSLPEEEVNQIIAQGVENRLSDFQIIDELRKRGLKEEELTLVNEKLLKNRREKLKAKVAEEPKESDNADSIPNQKEEDKDQLLSNKVSKQSNIFGREIFTKNFYSFAPETRLASPENYFLGAGDRLIVDLSGVHDKQQYVTVSPEGYIRVDLVGPIYVAGISLIEAKAKIKGALGKFLPQVISGTTKVSLYLSSLRTIQILIAGEATRPGNYAVSSLSTVLNALYECGGPSDIGSFRQIELIRGNKVLDTIDLYPYLTKGILKKDYRLEERDVIRIPVSEKIVTIDGAVKKPKQIELLKGENLFHLIQYAGGFKEGAYRAQIQIERFTDREKIVLDVSEKEIPAFELHSGDLVSVGFVLDRYNNKVTVSGSVFRPGSYSLESAQTITALVQKSLGLKPEAYQERALLFRNEVDDRKTVLNINLKSLLGGEIPDIPLRAEDELLIKSIFELETETTVTLNGSVQSPGAFPFRDGIRLKDLIFLAGGLLEDSYNERIIIYRKGTDNRLETISLPISNNLSDDIPLKSGDIIHIQSEKQLKEVSFVTITGEVKKPGTYEFGENLSLQDLVVLSEGLTEYASSSNIEITRRLDSIDLFDRSGEISKSITFSIDTDLSDKGNEFFLKPYDIITIRRNPQIIKPSFVKIEGEVLFPGEYTLQKRDERISSLFLRAGGGLPEANLLRAQLIRKIALDTFNLKVNKEKITADENIEINQAGDSLLYSRKIKVALNLTEAIKNPGSIADIFLENGDILMVPKLNNLIIVEGEVFEPIAINHLNGKGTKFYINQAGGFKSIAQKSKTFIIYPDGRALATRKILGIFNSYPKIEPGSVVTVPKMEEVVKQKRPFNINDLTLASSTIAGISTLILGFLQLIK